MVRLRDVQTVPKRVPVGSKCTVKPIARPVENSDAEVSIPIQLPFTQPVPEPLPLQHCQEEHTPPGRVEHGDSHEPLLYPDRPEVQDYEATQSERSLDENGASEDTGRVETGKKPRRWTFLSISILALSIYSTGLSGLWLVVAIIQPHWGSVISTTGSLNPSTANLVTALLAKTIEITFVTVFISFLGQVLTRRSLEQGTDGINLAEITMRSWVVQPGSLITHYETVSIAGFNILGVGTILAAITSLFFTTASEAMVAPKLKFSHEEPRTLSGYVRASYGNLMYIAENCKTLQGDDYVQGSMTCLLLQLQLESAQDLLKFGQIWDGHDYGQNLTERPTVLKSIDNTTLESSWIDTQYSDVSAEFQKTGRIINNATMAWPHPGVAIAATSKLNAVLQPADLGGIGRYVIKAQVVSPVINALCVEMEAEELAPIVYIRWPNAQVNDSWRDGEVPAVWEWSDNVPGYSKPGDDGGWLNATVVDDIFHWGQKYSRRPPVFGRYPHDFNMINTPSDYNSDAVYFLGKVPASDNYTLCELRSWITPKCYTQYLASGASGSSMQVICGDDLVLPTYQSLWPPDTSWPSPSKDWWWTAELWQTSLGFGPYGLDTDAPNARLLTQLALNDTTLKGKLPSLAEALVVSASTTVLRSMRDTSFRHDYKRDAEFHFLDAPGKLEAFNATIQTHKYTSGHVDQWHRMFYVILGLAFAINLFCLATFIMRRGLVTDITEPQNTFIVALNGPPSERLKGSFETGLKSDHLAVPWRVVPTSEGKDYKIEEVRILKGG